MILGKDCIIRIQYPPMRQNKHNEYKYDKVDEKADDMTEHSMRLVL